MSKKIAVASHVAMIDGGQYDGIGNVVKETLNQLGSDYIFVRHSIDGRLRSEAQVYQGGKITKALGLGVIAGPAPVRYMSEVLRTVGFFSRHEKVEVYVGIDPLNALAGILLRKRGRVKKAIFYTADYSPKRFNSGLLNKVYHMIDEYCVRNADEVWSVSTRICGVRRDMGLADDKNIFIPNVPPSGPDNLSNAEHDKYELVTTGIIDEQLDFEGTMKAMVELSDELPRLHFTIVGNGPREGYLRELAKELGIQDRVRFTGRLPLAEALEIQASAGIGLALYTGVWGFNQYGDSTKCREYFNFGLPVISTDTHSTVEDIRKWQAGIIVGKSIDSYKMAIREVLSRYDEYSEHSLGASREHKDAHRKIFHRLITE